MTLSESEISVFALPKVIKERSIGGEDTQLHSDRDGGRSERENFGEEDGRALTQEGNPKLQRREQQDHRASYSWVVHSHMMVLRFSWDFPSDSIGYYIHQVWVNLQ